MRVTTINCDKCKKELQESEVNLMRLQDGGVLRKNYELCNKCTREVERIVDSNESFVRYRLKKAVQIIKNWEEKVGNEKAIEVTGCAIGHVTDILDAIAEELTHE